MTSAGSPPAILAHRANLAGPAPAAENSLAACERALAQGFGLETDLRRDEAGAFYIAHDPQPRTPENDFAPFARLFRGWPARVIAMNVKELGYEEALIALRASGDLGHASFYFDFELLEPAAPGTAQRRLRSLPGGVSTPLASRLSDRGETLAQCLAIPAEVVWADEFDRLWLGREEVEAVHAAGRKFYAISPELHGFREVERFRRWEDFRAWGIDGLCTDFALEARDFFRSLVK
jgi:glycerophosphoryl diester phosphodiesterase